jgi:hypothetical protein
MADRVANPRAEAGADKSRRAKGEEAAPLAVSKCLALRLRPLERAGDVIAGGFVVPACETDALKVIASANSFAFVFMAPSPF